MTPIRNVLAGTVLAGGALLAAAGFSLASAADATTPPGATAAPGGHHWHHHGGMWHLYSQLGLTEEQKTSIKAIFTAAKPQMKTLHQQMQANQLKLSQTAPDNPSHASVVAEVAQSNATLASQRTTQAEELRAQIYAVLTPAQKTQLATLVAQRAAKAAARESAAQ